MRLGRSGWAPAIEEDRMISRVRIDAYGTEPAELHAELLAMATACDNLTGRPSCAYGEQVIERNLTEEDGTSFAWKGRITIHPDVGTEPFVPGEIAAASRPNAD